MSEILITPEGYERLRRELEELKTVKRREIVERIKAARALGDLSENFDYQDAKRQQAFLEGRIKDLETVLSRAKVVPRPDNAGEVVLGRTAGEEVAVNTPKGVVRYRIVRIE